MRSEYELGTIVCVLKSFSFSFQLHVLSLAFAFRMDDENEYKWNSLETRFFLSLSLSSSYMTQDNKTLDTYTT